MKTSFLLVWLVSLLTLSTISSFASHGPRIQFIHNVTALSAETVDITKLLGVFAVPPIAE